MACVLLLFNNNVGFFFSGNLFAKHHFGCILRSHGNDHANAHFPSMYWKKAPLYRGCTGIVRYSYCALLARNFFIYWYCAVFALVLCTFEGENFFFHVLFSEQYQCTPCTYVGRGQTSEMNIPSFPTPSNISKAELFFNTCSEKGHSHGHSHAIGVCSRNDVSQKGSH